MLSYTVHRKETLSYEADEAKQWADHVRNQIPTVKEDWSTHAGVETTLTGSMDLYGSYDKVGLAKLASRKRSNLSSKMFPANTSLMFCACCWLTALMW